MHPSIWQRVRVTQIYILRLLAEAITTSNNDFTVHIAALMLLLLIFVVVVLALSNSFDKSLRRLEECLLPVRLRSLLKPVEYARTGQNVVVVEQLQDSRK